MSAATLYEFAPPKAPVGLGAIALALLAHAALIAALAWGTNWAHTPKVEAVQAELWATLPVQAAPAAPPAPPPVVEPPAPPPLPAVVEPVALPAEIVTQKATQTKTAAIAPVPDLERKLAELKAKDASKQQAITAAKDKADKAAASLKAEAAAKARQEADDAARMDAQRAENLRRIAGMAGAGDAGKARVSSGPSAEYGGRIKARIKPNITFTEEVSGNPETEIEVRTAADGRIISRRVVKASGNRNWDDAVLKAIDKTEVLPRDENGRVPPELTIVFRRRD